MGGTRPAQSAVKKFFGPAPPLFFGSTSTISRFRECFRDGQYSLISLLFAVSLLTCPAICKSGGGGTCAMGSTPVHCLGEIDNV